MNVGCMLVEQATLSGRGYNRLGGICVRHDCAKELCRREEVWKPQAQEREEGS